MVDTRIVQVEALPGYRVRLRFRDGTQGQADLSSHVTKGVFSRLQDHAEFAKVRVSEHGGLVWGDDLDLCSDALYMQITGLTAEEVFSAGQKRRMPELCRFYGIIIGMFFADHNPPHFHAEYGDTTAVIEIDGLGVLRSDLPSRALGLAMIGHPSTGTN